MSEYKRVSTWTIRLMGEHFRDQETPEDLDHRNAVARSAVIEYLSEEDIENDLSSLLPDGYYVKVEE